MTECSEYQLEISALLDGESDPATAFELLEHVGNCRSCGAFVRQLRRVQEEIDRAYATEEQPHTPVTPLRRERPAIRMPRWGWGLAATLVVAMGLTYAVQASPSSPFGADSRDREIVIRLDEDSGAMSEGRFMELLSELLRADQMYRNQMFSVLSAVGAGEMSDEMEIMDENPDTRGSEGERRVGDTSTRALN